VNKKITTIVRNKYLKTMLLLSKLNYRGDWYLLRAKFTTWLFDCK